MPMPKYAARVDANQRDIVRLLEQIPDVTVYVVGKPVDLLVGYQAKNYLFEIKDGNKKDYEHKYTDEQRDFLRDWKGQVRVAKSFEEVWEVMVSAYEST